MRAAAAASLRTVPWAAIQIRGALGVLRARLARLSPRGRRRLLACAAATLGLMLLYYGWFRDSSFVRVEKVTVTGLTTSDAPRVRARLMAAAKRMTTLHVDEEALRRAIGAGFAVSEIRVTTDFPHGMRIEVVEKAPVAVLVGAGSRVAVAADGTLLPKAQAGGLPSIVVGAMPTRSRLGRGRALRIVTAAAAAPAALRSRIQRMRELPGKGLVAYLRRGPQVILGDGTSLRAKWAAAAAVLADGASRGASYVDVRLPERPVAGGVDVPQAAPDQPTADVPTGPASATAPPLTTAPGAAAQGGQTPYGGGQTPYGGVTSQAPGTAGQQPTGPQPSTTP